MPATKTAKTAASTTALADWQARRAAAVQAMQERNIRLAAARAADEAAWAAKTEREVYRNTWQCQEYGRYSLAGTILHYSETIVLVEITLGDGRKYINERKYRDSQYLGGPQYPASQLAARLAQLEARK